MQTDPDIDDTDPDIDDDVTAIFGFMFQIMTKLESEYAGSLSQHAAESPVRSLGLDHKPSKGLLQGRTIRLTISLDPTDIQ